MPEVLRVTPASCVTDWLTVLRAAEALRFTRVVPWDHPLHYCEFSYSGPGSLCRDIVIDGEKVWTKADADV